jgi:transcriptional regulator with XRE-family HTH domain
MDIHPLRAWRERQEPKMSRANLARLLGVSPPQITRWEAGQRDISIKAIARIAERTGISPAELRPDFAQVLRVAS